MNYAQLENNIVVNIVVADSIWIDEQPGNFVSIGSQNVEIGSTYENGVFIPPKPYPSWTRYGNSWQAPKPLPSDTYDYTTGTGVIYAWDENTATWIAHL